MTRAARKAHIDLETFSVVDLPKLGAHIYAADPSTDVICLAWAFDADEPEIWRPGMPIPERLAAHIEEGGACAAWNYSFERLLFRHVLGPKYGWPVPVDDQWDCVMARAYAMGLPGKLEHAAPAIGLNTVKDAAGGRIMMKWCRPRRVLENGTIVRWDDQGERAQLEEYCKQDVRTEQALDTRLMGLSEKERQIFLLDCKINDRGVRIDQNLAVRAMRVVEQATGRLDKELKHLTGGYVSAATNVQKLKQWLSANGVETESLDKERLAELLDNPSVALPPKARRALQIRREAAKTSTAKIRSMLERSKVNGRMRGNLQYHGAGTGRWTARGAQLQNLPRPVFDPGEVAEIIQLLATGADDATLEVTYGPTLTCIADSVRGMIAADPGRQIMAADFSNIEGRVLAWLAGENWKVRAFADFDAGHGADIYLLSAAGIYNVPASSLTKKSPERQVGKTAELALGYAGGVGAFANMAKNYAVDMGPGYPVLWARASIDDREKAQDAYRDRGKTTATKLSREAWIASELVKLAWRERHPATVAYWRALERAALDAVESPGKAFRAGRVVYRQVGSFLWCRLPGGHAICYAYPRVEMKKTPWGAMKPQLIVKGVDSVSRKWTEYALHGGVLTNNVVQGTARDLMAEAMLRIDAAGYPVVLTVHDEVVAEPPTGASFDRFVDLMKELPAWAAGLPVAADGWQGARYRK